MEFDLRAGEDGVAVVAIETAPSEELLRALLAAAERAGATRVVVETGHEAGEAWIRAGFTETVRRLEAPIDVLARHGRPPGASHGAVFVQTDELDQVARAVALTIPRLPGGSRGSAALATGTGWVAVHDELCDREPEMLRRLAVELSDRFGAVVLLLGVEEDQVVRFLLLERGRTMDEYLSVPQYHGPLPPGEVVALAANPTVVARLTGASPETVRALARTAERPGDLPPAPELHAALRVALGLGSGPSGYREAAGAPGAVLLQRG